MMMFPTLPRLLATMTICAALAACGESAPSASTAAASAASTPSPSAADTSGTLAASAPMLDTVKVNLPDNAPVVTVVTTGKSLPFSSTAPNGSLVGMDVDVITKIGEASGFRVQILKRPWDNLFSEVDMGQHQLAISGISFTPERKEKYDLSDSYANNASILMFSKPELQSQITDLKSLKNIPNLTVGVLDKSKHAKQMSEAGVPNIKPFKTTYLLYTGLLKGEVDVIAQDGLLLQEIAKQHDSKVYTFTYEDENEPSAQLVILMKKDSPKLLKTVNDGLAKIKANGELKKIHEKWLGNQSSAK